MAFESIVQSKAKMAGVAVALILGIVAIGDVKEKWVAGISDGSLASSEASWTSR